MSESDVKEGKSNINLIEECDNFPYCQRDLDTYMQYVSTYYHFRVPSCPRTLGYVLPSVAEVFRNLPDWEVDDFSTPRTLTLIFGDDAVFRSAAVARTVQAMRETGHFQVLEGWRDELYPVYDSDGSILFSLERSASPLFGIITYGVHMTAFTKSNSSYGLKIWVPRRAKNKQTYPGMLDNSVAGGIASGENIFESLVRECAEEASLPESVVRESARPGGTVTYFYLRDARAGGETGLMQPECQYVYDLELPEDVTPKPGDEEVQEFYLWTVEEVQEALRKGEFKPNCALVILDFFVRHGIITSANEKHYIQLVSRLHRHLEFPTP
ncbi:thiamine pyrophosphokinase-related protein-like protein [Eremomyces bilateralis CBS 781.70]|uniref:Thiamine pyrophosphokinase-related protein-like protein n=1 Tax=Eremomyces bilateralis CBS 781.70 TaxID=1392243 RepID=A0A6G1FXR6_9PEZI|nr:thiamine pyrophosphokinase-related protein-like protein [Eremomyces bilateralis CBS 781.70]KAF1810480.1 thiamine pyrophosphokinase-related protein-like protein [Eremomyces bilateralis CBS 781.70]